MVKYYTKLPVNGTKDDLVPYQYEMSGHNDKQVVRSFLNQLLVLIDIGVDLSYVAAVLGASKPW